MSKLTVQQGLAFLHDLFNMPESDVFKMPTDKRFMLSDTITALETDVNMKAQHIGTLSIQLYDALDQLEKKMSEDTVEEKTAVDPVDQNNAADPAEQKSESTLSEPVDVNLVPAGSQMTADPAPEKMASELVDETGRLINGQH